MSEPGVYGPIFGDAPPLPRGPHSLSREDVAASQRSRLLSAIVEVVAEHGYAGATIAEIGRRAGVSPRTFYEHFDDKLGCYLAAYDRFATVVLERLREALDGDAAWPELLTGGLSSYLAVVRDNPDAARAFALELHAAGPEARTRRRETDRRFAALLRASHERTRREVDELGPLPDTAFLGIVHGVRGVVGDHLDTTDRPRPLGLADDLAGFVIATLGGSRRPAAR